ncbi:MAG: ECF transporter S component [Eubacteriales bacterium]|nr:ECF transporter S component [Eubacteriales bacterium]MDD4745384.1 ECF transporter S component [Eubacteriales bacterium]
MNSTRKTLIRLVLAGMFLALGLVLPFLTGQIPQFGSMLLPMHIPVLICGFVCGWPYGLVVGLITPVLRSLMFGMPPMFPGAVAMAFELAAYGFMTGLLYKLLPKKVPFIYVTLAAAMLVGRVVWGLVTFLLVSSAGSAFTFSAFLAGAFVNAVPGIIVQIVLIPIIILALQKAHLMKYAD